MARKSSKLNMLYSNSGILNLRFSIIYSSLSYPNICSIALEIAILLEDILQI
jgi:hypothetical protein